MNRAARILLAVGVQLSAVSGLQAQKSQWTDMIYVPGRWVGGRLVRATTRSASDSMALVMRVDYFANPPRWRAEIRRSPDGQAFTQPQVLLGDAGTVLVVTPVGTTPLSAHEAGRDTMVQAAAAVMGGAGRRSGPASGRIVERAAGLVRRVVFRRAVRSPAFDDRILDPRRSGGPSFIASRVASVGDQRSASVVATAGARGVDNVQTPNGTVPVTPDTAAVLRMESFSVGALRLEDFMRVGTLGPYKLSPEDAAADSAAADSARADAVRADSVRADSVRRATVKRDSTRARTTRPRARPRRTTRRTP